MARSFNAVLALVTLWAGCDGLETNPSSVRFANQEYRVELAWDAAICNEHQVATLSALGDGRQLPEGHLVVFDADRDGTDDVAVYSKHHGFRDHFGYMTIFLNHGIPLSKAEPIVAKWKEGHWAWIDVAELPALGEAHSPVMRWVRDQDRESWFW